MSLYSSQQNIDKYTTSDQLLCWKYTYHKRPAECDLQRLWDQERAVRLQRPFCTFVRTPSAPSCTCAHLPFAYLDPSRVQSTSPPDMQEQHDPSHEDTQLAIEGKK